MRAPPNAIEPATSGELPEKYTLAQNYPNPFNPSAAIEYSLPKAGFVTLKVNNILGEEAAALVSKKLAAGNYRYNWDVRGLASGIYFYRLLASPPLKGGRGGCQNPQDAIAE